MIMWETFSPFDSTQRSCMQMNSSGATSHRLRADWPNDRLSSVQLTVQTLHKTILQMCVNLKAGKSSEKEPI